MHTPRATPGAYHATMLAILSLGAAAPLSARAQAAEPAAPGKLETITVNAEKLKGFQAKTVQVGAFRDQEMLDVPLTVNVVPRAVLDAQDAHGLYDALRNTAGVARAQLNGAVYDNLSIRGVNFDNRTSYRLNGGLPIVNLIDLPLENKERVEVLKGASSMYYGFTSPVGVVNLVTKRAQDDPITAVAFSGNEYGQAVVHFDMGRKLGANKEFGLRVNVVGGELRNAIDNVKGHRSLGSIALDWSASNFMTLHFDYEAIRKKITEQAVIVAPGAGTSVATARVLPELPDPRRLISGDWAVYNAHADNAVLRADFTLSDNWAALVEIGRAETVRDRNELDMQNYNLVTGATTRAAFFATVNNVNVNQNVRAELTGRLGGWLDHEVSLGVMANRRLNNAPTVPSNTSVSQNLYDPMVIPKPTVTPSTLTSPQTIIDRGIYLQDRVRFLNDWQVILGARYENYANKKVANTATTSTTTVQNIKKTTTSAALLYKIRKDTSLYASYIEGLEEGGVAASTFANAGEVLPAAVSKQSEFGVRTEALPGVTASLAYFELKRASAARNAANFFVLDGRTNYKGLEFAASGDVGKQLSLVLSGLVLNAKLANQTNPLFNGNAPDNTAKNTYSLFAEYRPEAVPGLSVNGGIYYVGKRPLDNLDINYVPAYNTLSAGLRYRTSIVNTPTSFQLNVENLSNKRYWSAANGGFIGVGMPRTVSFAVKVDL